MKRCSEVLLASALTSLMILLLSLELMGEEKRQSLTSAPTKFRLQDLQKIALENNPTLAQAAAEVGLAEGRMIQSGLYPNPIVGYEGEEISMDEPSERSTILFSSSRELLRRGSSGSAEMSLPMSMRKL